jgi:hypothetical protein
MPTAVNIKAVATSYIADSYQELPMTRRRLAATAVRVSSPGDSKRRENAVRGITTTREIVASSVSTTF